MEAEVVLFMASEVKVEKRHEQFRDVFGGPAPRIFQSFFEKRLFECDLPSLSFFQFDIPLVLRGISRVSIVGFSSKCVRKRRKKSFSVILRENGANSSEYVDSSSFSVAQSPERVVHSQFEDFRTTVTAIIGGDWSQGFDDWPQRCVKIFDPCLAGWYVTAGEAKDDRSARQRLRIVLFAGNVSNLLPLDSHFALNLSPSQFDLGDIPDFNGCRFEANTLNLSLSQFDLGDIPDFNGCRFEANTLNLSLSQFADSANVLNCSAGSMHSILVRGVVALFDLFFAPHYPPTFKPRSFNSRVFSESRFQC
jgi:hypothetical protein